MAISLPRPGMLKKTVSNPAVQKPAADAVRTEQRAPQQQTAAPATAPRQAAPQQNASAPLQGAETPAPIRRVFGTAQEEMFSILRRGKELNASDVLLSVGLPPVFRVNGELIKDKFPVLSPDILKKLVYSFLRQEQVAEYERDYELDLSLSVPGIARYRVNVYRQKKFVGAAFRSISEEIPTLQDLNLSKAIEKLAMLPRGLVLVTGPTGSGKSSTLAAMINHINHRKSTHIITIEDPIEFVHPHINCVVDQRELKSDTYSFSTALKQSLRQDPDVILVGEMRDLETISAAISAAETGHLVLSTLHTQDSAQTVDRIVDVFPSHQQEQIRAQLSTTLRGIVAQQLLPAKNGGRVAAREVLLVTPAIANLVREGKTYQINSAIQTGHKLGMVTMDASLTELYQKGQITYEDALSKAVYPENIKPQL
jgi:twitching motility protein PilT